MRPTLAFEAIGSDEGPLGKFLTIVAAPLLRPWQQS
jgi:hypothetical protein